MNVEEYLGAYVEYKGQLGKIIAVATRPQVIIELLEPPVCPHCNKELPPEQIHIDPQCPNWESSVKPLKTIKG